METYLLLGRCSTCFFFSFFFFFLLRNSYVLCDSPLISRGLLFKTNDVVS